MTEQENKLQHTETSKSLPIAMLRAREAIMLSFRPVLAKHGFTEQQWRVLRVLGEKGPADAGQVAFEACILAPSLSRIIGKLEKDKYISRFIDAKDGRRINLSLTSLGKETLQKIVPEIGIIYNSLEKSYGEEKLTTLLELLSEISQWKGR
ncbi:homoprotocatechuate degradation operon regulator HpaR [Alphaproteobacteria bacterium]|jgi:homoprotocatechuate degradation regulator HpaR|nr:homoprotocatechuate degradation operon regulator HpaR [Alphaproteobacteria bacterium]|tara:strand:+ start:4125 stop:4577 length:453 start_codon:yes stop_codon:yes gene_type:complete